MLLADLYDSSQRVDVVLSQPQRRLRRPRAQDRPAGETVGSALARRSIARDHRRRSRTISRSSHEATAPIEAPRAAARSNAPSSSQAGTSRPASAAPARSCVACEPPRSQDAACRSQSSPPAERPAQAHGRAASHDTHSPTQPDPWRRVPSPPARPRSRPATAHDHAIPTPTAASRPSRQPTTRTDPWQTHRECLHSTVPSENAIRVVPWGCTTVIYRACWRSGRCILAATFCTVRAWGGCGCLGRQGLFRGCRGSVTRASEFVVWVMERLIVVSVYLPPVGVWGGGAQVGATVLSPSLRRRCRLWS